MLLTSIGAYLLIYGIVYFESVKSGKPFDPFSNVTPFIIFPRDPVCGFHHRSHRRPLVKETDCSGAFPD